MFLSKSFVLPIQSNFLICSLQSESNSWRLFSCMTFSICKGTEKKKKMISKCKIYKSLGHFLAANRKELGGFFNQIPASGPLWLIVANKKYILELNTYIKFQVIFHRTDGIHERVVGLLFELGQTFHLQRGRRQFPFPTLHRKPHVGTDDILRHTDRRQNATAQLMLLSTRGTLVRHWLGLDKARTIGKDHN